MKHIKTIHIVLCGLVSGTIEASERMPNQANTSQSRNIPQNSLPIPIVSKTIPLKKRRNSSFSSSYSPRTNQTPPQRNYFPNSVSPSSASPSLSLINNDEYSIVVNKFFVETKGKYHLLNTDGSINEYTYITDEDKPRHINHYQAQLTIKDNKPSVTTTHMIIPGNKPLEHQSVVQTNLTSGQQKKLQRLHEDKKIMASDDLKNLYYIKLRINNSSDSSEQS